MKYTSTLSQKSHKLQISAKTFPPLRSYHYHAESRNNAGNLDLGQELFLLQVSYYTILKGQEKQALLSYLNHEREISQSRGIHSPTSARAHDQRNLRDDSRCQDIPLPKEKDKACGYRGVQGTTCRR